jgi:hypothetical protein
MPGALTNMRYLWTLGKKRFLQKKAGEHTRVVCFEDRMSEKYDGPVDRERQEPCRRADFFGNGLTPALKLKK